MRSLSQRLETLQAHGFDGSYISSAEYVTVGCTQCAASVINGVACHEAACPHLVHECKGCNTLVPSHVRYCEDCR